MAVTARFEADFQSFYAAVQKAEGQLKDFEDGAGKVEKSLNRMTDAFSGRKVIQDATLMAKAIDDAGGVSKLTAKELEQAGAKAAEAAEKMRKLGIDVPPGIQKLADAAEKAGASWGKLGSIVGAAAGALSVTAIVGATKSLLDFADSTVNVAEKTGFSTDAVQELTAAFKPHGIEIDQVAAANEKLAKNLVGGDKSTVNALEKMGLSISDLKKLSPDDLFITVADAVGQIQNPTEKAFAAMTVFGKGGQELLGGLDGHLKDTTQSFMDMGLVIDRQTIKAADDFGDQLLVVGKQLLGVVASIVGPLLPALSALAESLAYVGTKVIGPILGGAVKVAETAILGLWEALATLLARLADLATKVPLVGKHLGFLSDASAFLQKSADGAGTMMADLWNHTENVGNAAKVATPKMIGLGESTDGAGKKADEAAKALKALMDQIVKIEGTKADFKTLSLAEAFKEMGDSVPAPSLKDLSDQSLRSATDLDALRGNTEQLERAGRFLSVGAVDVNKRIGVEMQAAAQTGTKALEQMKSTALTVGQSILGAFTTSLSGLNRIFEAAFEGGGGVAGAIQSFATNVTSNLLSLIPAVGPFLSQFGGALVSGLKKIFGSLGGPSQDELSARALFGKSFKDVNDLIDQASKAYALMGYSGVKAESDIKAVLDATHVSAQAEAAALATVNGVLEQAKQKAADVSSAVDGIVSAGQALQGGIPANVQAAIEAITQMQGVTDEEKQKLLGLIADTKPNFQALIDTAANYGISLEGLGPKFEQAHITDTAAKIYDDFQQLTNAGADVGGVLSGMSDEISGLVNDAIKFGGTVPEQFHPLIQNLIDAGKLLDDNGDAITDITKIKFADTPLDTGMDRLTKALDHLTDILTKLPGVAADAAKGIGDNLGKTQVPPITVPFDFSNVGSTDFTQFTNVAHGSTGGLVTDHGILYAREGAKVLRMLPRGSDTVPAMLTPGERVLSVGQNKAFEAGAWGGGGVSITNHIHAEGAFFDTPDSRRQLANKISEAVMDRLRLQTRLQVVA